MSWYAPLAELESRGRHAKRPGSLAGLHEARREHLGQFFTPTPLAHVLWRLVLPAIERALTRKPGSRVALYDNSVGSGRLLQFADPERHELGAVDVDGVTLKALTQAVTNAGFRAEVGGGGMESARPTGFGVSLLNPPFSLHLEAPTLEPYPCTTWGRFGATSSAVSHAYALHQSLEAAHVVGAILPETYAETLESDRDLSPRLRAIVMLPAGSFREENTEVRVAIAVFGHAKRRGAQVIRLRLASLSDPIPDLGLDCPNTYEQPWQLRSVGVEDEGPAIQTPVTGDSRVRVVHNGRRLQLKFACGLTEAKVLNAVYKDLLAPHRMENHRYPAGLKYLGEGALDLEVHLAQPDPMASFGQLLDTIRAAGGVPDVDPGLNNYLRKRIRQLPRQLAPFAHTAFMPNGMANGNARATVRATFALEPDSWVSPLLEKGAVVDLTDGGDGNFTFTAEGKRYILNRDQAFERFEVQESAGGWVNLTPGRHEEFPDLAVALGARVRALGIDSWMDWPHQESDLVELMIAPNGAVVGWDTGLGKARLASALILLSGCRHGLVTVFPYLLDEMLDELKALPISPDEWQVIERPEQLTSLRRINVITYNRLRSSTCKAGRRRTYAHALRRRIGVLVADEGELLANSQSDQARALWQLSARKRFVLTATPIGNYPRDTLPLRVFTSGDGVAHQPYGLRRWYLDPILRQTTMTAQRGIDKFREDFVTLEWVTHEWEEDMQSGAKREVPKIANLEEYRRRLRPHLKRRVADEPDIAGKVRIPKPAEEFIELPWDERHLGFYLDVAERFAHEYRQARATADERRQQLNLVALLARIRAVEIAASFPQRGVEGFGAFTGLTSKQRHAIETLKGWADDGRKAILYAENPGLLELLHRELAEDGYESLLFHGGLNIKKRTQAMKQHFRRGRCPLLLAGLRVTQAGLNIPEASRGYFYDRGWTWKTEKQAQGRMLRPQQMNDVLLMRAHLRGSIDVYKGQMVAFKRDAFRAGLDFATPEFVGAEFAHLDTMLHRFVEDLAQMRNMTSRELLDALTRRAA